MQKLIKLLRGNTSNGLLFGDAAFLVHLNGNLQSRKRRTLTNTGLEHPELTVFNGKLNIHHVCIVILKNLKHVEKLFSCLLKCGDLNQIGNRLSVANTGNNIFTLCINQEIAVALVCSVGRITRESNACCRGLALITENHNLNVDGRTKIIRNLVLLTIENGAIVHPRTKDCLLRKAKLKIWIGGEYRKAALGNFRMLFNINVCCKDTLKPRYKLTKIVCREFRIKCNALLGLLSRNCILKELTGNAHNNTREHLDKASI